MHEVIKNTIAFERVELTRWHNPFLKDMPKGNVRYAEVCSIIGNPHAGLEALAEAGALIAAEIDRLNTLDK